MLCYVLRAIDELESYYTYVQEVSHIGTLTYPTVWIAFVFLHVLALNHVKCYHLGMTTELPDSDYNHHDDHVVLWL